jgi:hypothetical protein
MVPRQIKALELGCIVAEVYAIKACAVEILDRNYKNRNIYILSDSQAAINPS